MWMDDLCFGSRDVFFSLFLSFSFTLYYSSVFLRRCFLPHHSLSPSLSLFLSRRLLLPSNHLSKAFCHRYSNHHRKTCITIVFFLLHTRPFFSSSYFTSCCFVGVTRSKTSTLLHFFYLLTYLHAYFLKFLLLLFLSSFFSLSFVFFLSFSLFKSPSSFLLLLSPSKVFPKSDNICGGYNRTPLVFFILISTDGYILPTNNKSKPIF